MTLEVIASQTIGTDGDEFDIGDSLTMAATLDLPGLSPDQMADLKFEVFGMSSTKGRRKSFRACFALLKWRIIR